MEVSTWYQWMFIYAYYLGGVLLVVASFFLFLRSKSIIALLCCIGFVAFISGTYMLRNIDSKMSEARQTNKNTVQLEHKWVMFRAISSIGFLLGSAGLVVVAVRRNKGGRGQALK